MVKESSFGLMGKTTRANGKMDLNMDLAYGDLVRVIVIWDNGKMEKYRGMVFILLHLGKNIKANLKIF